MSEVSYGEVIDYTKTPPLIEGNPPLSQIDDSIAMPMEKLPSKKYFIALGITLTMLMTGVVAVGYTFYYGVGMWGNNIPVAWGFAITNFVFWIGIGHAGTLISAILFLFRQRWRTAIARLRRSHDDFRGDVRRTVSAAASWEAMVCRIHFPDSEPAWCVDQFQFAPRVGCVRGLHIFHGLANVLVHRTDSRPGYDAGKNDEQIKEIDLHCSQSRLEIFKQTLAALRKSLCDFGRACYASRAFGPQHCQLRFCSFNFARLAYDYFPSLFRSRRDILGLRNGADRSHYRQKSF